MEETTPRRPDRVPAAFWALLVGLPFLFFTAMYFIDGTRTLDSQWVIEDGETMLTERSDPPSQDAGWERRNIPATVWGTDPERSSVWWRIVGVSASGQHDAEWIVMIPFPDRSNYGLWVNGQFVAEKGSFDSPPGMLRRPVVFTLPAHMLSRPDNEIHIRIVRGNAGARLAALAVGPRSELGNYAQYMQRMLGTLPEMLVSTMLLLAIIMGAVHLRRRRHGSVNGWYGLMLAVWAFDILLSLVESPAFGGYRFWTSVSLINLGIFVCVCTIFINRFVAAQHPLIERTVLLWTIAGALYIAIFRYLDLSIVWFVNWIWVPGMLAAGIYMIAQLVRAVRAEPDWDRLSLLIITVLVVSVGIRDYLYNNLGVLPGNITYLRFAAGIALIVFSLTLIRRFVHALDTVESVNETLEARIQEKARALELEHQKATARERERVLIAERRRLLQEMHDGLGGHLVHALAIAESDREMGRVVPPLNHAIDDLRLIVDSMESSESTFQAMFSSLRQRCTQTAENLGLNLVWEITEDRRLQTLGAHEALNLARIVQEAVTNVIKHASASTLSVRGSIGEGNRMWFEVSDDGCGMPARHTNGGRGLHSMATRARELGAELNVTEGNPGTTVRIEWPMEAAG